MLEHVKISENFRDDVLLRNAFHDFVSQVFPSADFKQWYAKGFWSDDFQQISNNMK